MFKILHLLLKIEFYIRQKYEIYFCFQENDQKF